MTSIHILSLSRNTALFDPTSESILRQQRYAGYFSHTTVLVLNCASRATRLKPRAYANLDIIPINAWGKLDLLTRAFSHASRLYKTHPFQLVTCEDALVTARVGKWLKEKFHIPVNIEETPHDRAGFFKKRFMTANIKAANATYKPIHLNLDPYFKPAHYRPIVKKIISIGELTPEYDYVNLIDGFSRITKAYPEAKLTIIGDGPEKSTLASMIVNLGLNDRIFLLGEKSPKEITALLHLHDIFVYTGSSIDLGEVIIHAFASGLPVITTPTKDGEDVFQPNTNCLVAASLESLVMSLTFLLAHPEEVYRLAKNGQQWVTANLESILLPKHFARQLLSLLR